MREGGRERGRGKTKEKRRERGREGVKYIHHSSLPGRTVTYKVLVEIAGVVLWVEDCIVSKKRVNVFKSGSVIVRSMYELFIHMHIYAHVHMYIVYTCVYIPLHVLA